MQKYNLLWHSAVKLTTDTDNHNSYITKLILPYNYNICYRIYLKLTEINGIGMPNVNIIH